jgi:hypothetical protein
MCGDRPKTYSIYRIRICLDCEVPERRNGWRISFEWEKSHPTWRFSYEILISSGLPKVSQMRTTVLEYLPTKLGHKNGVNVSKYSSTMEHLGLRMVHAEKIRVSMNKFLG